MLRIYEAKKKREIIGVKGFNDNLSAGVGFIIIPNGIDADLYKQDVYRTGKISMYGGYGYSNFHNVPIDFAVLQRINFPDSSDEYGTPVVWINIPKHDKPVIIGCLKYDEDFQFLTEYRRKTTVGNDGCLIDIDLDGGKGKGVINIVGKGRNYGHLDIKVSSDNNDALLSIDVDGQMIERVSNGKSIVSQKTINLIVTDYSNKTKSYFSIKSGDEKVKYEDEFKNLISISKERINIRADKSKKIDFGNGSEPVVLAKTLKSILDEYDDCLSKATFPTAFGPTGTRLNEGQFREVRKRFEDFYSRLLNTD